MIVFTSLCKAQVDVAELRTANCSSVRTLTYAAFTLSHTSCFLWFDPVQILLITSGTNTDRILFPIVSPDLHDKPYFVSWCN